MVHGDRGDQLDVQLGVVARHDHFHAFAQADDAGHVGGAEVELRTIVGEERGVTTALFLRQDIGFSHELGVRRDRARLAENLAAFDVFTITGRGTVATGRVERGTIKVGEEVEIVGLTEETAKTTVTGLEMFRKLLDFAQAGDNVGALLRGVQRSDIERGQVLAKPGSIHPHTKFAGQVYILKKDEGGRHTPFFNNYRPQFYFRTTDVTGVISLPEGVEMCMPGDNVTMDVELITPIAIEEGLRFAIREGGRTVGSGVVSKVNA